MKKILIICIAFFLMSLGGCSQAGKTKFSYWQGGVLNEFYVYVDSDTYYYKISGYPYLIMEYNVVNNQPVNALFGMSSYVRTTVYESSGFLMPAVPPPGPPELAEGNYGYEDKFTFNGTVIEILGWQSVGTNDDFSVGLWEFWFILGTDYNLEFSFDTAAMMGEFNNSNPTWDSFGSDTTNSIQLIYLKTDNGYF